MEDNAPIRAVLNNGRSVPCHACDCAECGNEFFVPGYSDEWMPNYCPYCGIKFVRSTRDGEAMDYSPAPPSAGQGPAPAG